jgi:hypothetical protein
MSILSESCMQVLISNNYEYHTENYKWKKFVLIGRDVNRAHILAENGDGLIFLSI